MERRNLSNPTVKQSSTNAHLAPPHTLAQTWKNKNRTRTSKRGREEMERGEGAAEGRSGTGLSVRCPEFRRTRCHPHDRAVCRGHLPHYGKCMHLGQALAGSSSAWAGKMAHWQLLLGYVSKLYTPHAHILHPATGNQQAKSFIEWGGKFWKWLWRCANISHEFRLGSDFFEQAVYCMMRYN